MDGPDSEPSSEPEVPKWESLGLSEEILSALEEQGYTNPTGVQAQAIPKALEGRDLLVRSKTGTGKTAAFMLPVLMRIPAGARKHSCIVLCPTRELVLQVAAEAQRLGANKDLRIVTIYGGVPIDPQTKALKEGAEIIVGTPGRVLDHIRRKNLQLGEGMMGVLDEADEMLSMGFFEEVNSILKELPTEAQILLFSATMEPRLRELMSRYLQDPLDLYLSLDTDRAADGVEHILYRASNDYQRTHQLLALWITENPRSAIVFCNMRSETVMVARFLSRHGFTAQEISSDLSQKARERVMGDLRAGKIDFLIATDIAARGIDISDLSHVFNYSLPKDPAVYLHRTGRTGRIGKKGRAISLSGIQEMNCRNTLKQQYGVVFEEHDVPNKQEAEEIITLFQVDKLRKAAQVGLPFESLLPLAKFLREKGPKADTFIALALCGFFRWEQQSTIHDKAPPPPKSSGPKRDGGGPNNRRRRGRGPRNRSQNRN
jgi:ATP-dependent RNA helicase DeaD